MSVQTVVYPPHVVKFMDRIGTWFEADEKWVIIDPLPSSVRVYELSDDYLKELSEMLDVARMHGIDFVNVWVKPNQGALIVIRKMD